MKPLVNQYDALDIRELARGGYLYPFSTYDWVWRTDRGTHQASVAITVLQDSLQLVFQMAAQRIQQGVRLTYSLGTRGGKRPGSSAPPVREGLACCITRMGCHFAVGPAAI